MIFLQIITGILLVPLLLLMIIVINSYIKHALWYLGVILLGLLISGSVGILFTDITYAGYSFGILSAVYLYRVYRLNEEFDKNLSGGED